VIDEAVPEVIRMGERLALPRALSEVEVVDELREIAAKNRPMVQMIGLGYYDTITPGMRFVRDSLEIAIDRCRKLYGIDGAVIFEASWLHNVSVFPFEGIPGHLRFHQLATIEIPAIMAETYAHTRDEKFLQDVLLPCAEAGLKFYFNRFPQTDAAGNLVLERKGA